MSIAKIWYLVMLMQGRMRLATMKVIFQSPVHAMAEQAQRASMPLAVVQNKKQTEQMAQIRIRNMNRHIVNIPMCELPIVYTNV